MYIPPVLLVIISIFLMAFTCSGCAQDFPSEHALAGHRPFCTKISASFGALLKRKRDAKIAQQDRRTRRRLNEVAAGQESNATLQIEPGGPLEEAPEPGPSSRQPARAYVEAMASGRHPRVHRAPKRIQDFLPSSLTSVHGLPTYLTRPPSPSPPPTSIQDNVPLPIPAEPEPTVPRYVPTKPNAFGLFRSYLEAPSHDPEAAQSLDDACDAPTFATAKQTSTPPWWSVFGRTKESVEKLAERRFAPFLNASTYYLMSWFYSGSSAKSLLELDRLIYEVLFKEDFNIPDLHGFSAIRESQRLDEWIDEESQNSEFPVNDGWHQSSVKISVPCERVEHTTEDAAPVFEVPNVFFRRLIDIIKTTLSSDLAQTFHLKPFKLWYRHPEQPPDSPAERAYSELFNSEAMNKEYESIKAQPSPPGPQIETVIAAIMLWSDSTHLAQFGSASLWPIYAFFGNQSKYVRCKPNAFAAHHLAYIPSLPDTFQDWYRKVYNKAASASVLTHCKRELMQAIWLLLLDEEFMHAYEHGVVIMFADGIERRVFPRIFTYSADYPEKVVLATIRYLAKCPCPRCLVSKAQIPEMGTKLDTRRRHRLAREDDENRRRTIDRTRSWIYMNGDPITNTWVDRLLSPASWVPTRNAFSVRLSQFGFNFHKMLVVDLLHEFELGVWKATFTHLMRILQALGPLCIQQLNERYRLVPTFGRSTIRRFTSNTSAMKKLAARDWEDMLQVAIPVFEGLLDEPYNSIVLDMLFIMATWHGLAKLRMHSDTTLKIFTRTTSDLGTILRRFSNKVCPFFATRELPGEIATRSRRAAAEAAKKSRTTAATPAAVQAAQAGRRQPAKGKAKTSATSGPLTPAPPVDTAAVPTTSVESSSSSGALQPSSAQPASSRAVDMRPHTKTFTLSTYKFHALGDYPSIITQFGTTDNYSTQTGELEHRRVKRFYGRTNRNKYTRQITKQHMREEVLRRIRRRHAKDAKGEETTPSGVHSTRRKTRLPNAAASLAFDDTDPLPYTPPDKHYHVSESNRYHEDLMRWLAQNRDDPAVKNFESRLKDHLLARLTEISDTEEPEFTDNDRQNLVIVNDRLYRHKVIRINYTTYDLRRAQDSLNPRTHADIMVRSQEDQDGSNAHPYWYARIVGIFHLYVQDFRETAKTSEPQRMDVLWVRWFGRDMTAPGGFRARRLYRIGFVSDDDPDAFGFILPDEVIRGVHLIPAFKHGSTDEYLPPSMVRPESDDDEDWVYYYVNIFVDRDMIMRFLGGGIGHRLLKFLEHLVGADETPGTPEGDEDAAEDEVEVINIAPGLEDVERERERWSDPEKTEELTRAAAQSEEQEQEGEDDYG
ncbi:hypothetical protein NM688_g8235 [Phlebia brevispora]|uniref:Uncharacterized protein n=1 Tax=Phlebia brevispora TaxID=194682 RepID=A0ACC1RVZ1_9APHY|nr:hypothetical protein NM688_g8235 [Phlebia brevispora]